MEYRKLTLEWEQKASMLSFETQMMNWFKSHFLTKILQCRGWLNGGEKGENSIFDRPKRPPVSSFFVAVERRGSFSRFSIFSVFLWGGKKRDKCVATLQARLMVLLLLADTASLDEAIQIPMLCVWKVLKHWVPFKMLVFSPRLHRRLYRFSLSNIHGPITTLRAQIPYNWSP